MKEFSVLFLSEMLLPRCHLGIEIYVFHYHPDFTSIEGLFWLKE